MALKVGKLWGNGTFQSLSKEAKLLYVYLITAPDLDILGLLNISLVRMELDLGFSEDVLREACKELVDVYIKIYKMNTQFYFFVLGHFDTFPSSDAVSKKANKQVKLTPEKILDHLVSDGLMPNIEHVSSFVEPAPEEVVEYGLLQGYLINGNDFINFYRDNAKRLGKQGWYDGRGKQVKDWKGKLRKVWSKRAQKIEPVEGAPEGFEYFYAMEGTVVYVPTRWSNNKPYSDKGLIGDKVLQDRFNELKGKS